MGWPWVGCGWVGLEKYIKNNIRHYADLVSIFKNYRGINYRGLAVFKLCVGSGFLVFIWCCRGIDAAGVCSRAFLQRFALLRD